MMIKRIMALLLGIIISSSITGFAQQIPIEKRPLPDKLKVMTFNVLYATPDDGILKAIKAADADIIGMQEVSESRLNYLARQMGYYYHHNGNHEASFDNDTGIMSRFPISQATRYGVTIYLSVDRPLQIYNVHLTASPYEPYDLRDEEITVEEAVEQARYSRYPEIQPVLEAMQKQLERGESVFLTGDFNEPSHLDWTSRAASAGMHMEYSVKWPTSSEITRHGLKDAYRTVYPDETKHPGFTWTTLTGDEDEIHDRIDIIYFSGENVKVVDASTVGTPSKYTDIEVSEYPSDHRSVVATFKLNEAEK